MFCVGGGHPYWSTHFQHANNMHDSCRQGMKSWFLLGKLTLNGTWPTPFHTWFLLNSRYRFPSPYKVQKCRLSRRSEGSRTEFGWDETQHFYNENLLFLEPDVQPQWEQGIERHRLCRTRACLQPFPQQKKMIQLNLNNAGTGEYTFRNGGRLEMVNISIISTSIYA